jgi:hypothetical protein
MSVQHFVLMTGYMTPAEERSLVQEFSKFGWWHNLPNAWLIAAPEGALDVTVIRQKIQNINSNVHCLVLEILPKYWASRANPSDPQITQWLLDYWGS